MVVEILKLELRVGWQLELGLEAEVIEAPSAIVDNGSGTVRPCLGSVDVAAQRCKR